MFCLIVQSVAQSWMRAPCSVLRVLEMPATVGVIGVVLVPWLAALGAIAALATNCKIVVEKRE